MSRRLNSNLSNGVRFDLRISTFQPDRANMKRGIYGCLIGPEREFAVLTP